MKPTDLTIAVCAYRSHEMTDVTKQLRDLADKEAAVDERLQKLAKESDTRVLRDPLIYVRDRRTAPRRSR